MATTFREFATECIMYPCSKEYMDLQKQAMEVEMMDRYLESQRYLQERAEFITESVSMEDGYLMEAASTETLQYYTEKQKTGIAKAWSNMLKGIKHLWNQFKKFWSRWMNGNDPYVKMSKDLLKRLKKYNFTTIGVDTLKEIVNNGMKLGAPYFVPRTRQPDLAKLHLQYADASNEATELRDRLCAALATSDVKADVSMVPTKVKLNNETLGIIDIKDLRDICRKIVTGGSLADINASYSAFMAAWKKAKVDGVVIPASSKEMNDEMREIEKFSNEMNTMIERKLTTPRLYGAIADAVNPMNKVTAGLRKGVDLANNTIGQKINVQIDPNKIQDPNLATRALNNISTKIYAAITSVMGAMMMMYNNCTRYRAYVLKNLTDYFNALDNNQRFKPAAVKVAAVSNSK